MTLATVLRQRSTPRPCQIIVVFSLYKPRFASHASAPTRTTTPSSVYRDSTARAHQTITSSHHLLSFPAADYLAYCGLQSCPPSKAPPRDLSPGTLIFTAPQLWKSTPECTRQASFLLIHRTSSIPTPRCPLATFSPIPPLSQHPTWPLPRDTVPSQPFRPSGGITVTRTPVLQVALAGTAVLSTLQVIPRPCLVLPSRLRTSTVTPPLSLRHSSTRHTDCIAMLGILVHRFNTREAPRQARALR